MEPLAPSSPSLHVAHIVLSLDVGGLERVVLDLVRQGPRLGQRVSVVCLERPGALASEAEALGARVVCVDKPRGLRPETVAKLKTTLRSLGPDVVHSHQIGALLYAGSAARRTRVPLTVHTEHGKHFAGRMRARLIGRLAGRYAARFFCVSKDIATEVQTCRIVPRFKLRVVSNGIDTARFGKTDAAGSARRREALGIPADAPVLGTIGRLNEVKRQDVLIRGFAQLPVEAHLLLVGDGPLMAELRALAAELGVEHRVHFAGYQAKPERWLALMDVFALTSRSEGMPLSILEAWAAGLPVVASRVGGLPELIEEGQTGLLFESGDDAALAGTFQSLLQDRELAFRLGAAGRALVQDRYDVQVMADNYERQYRELLAPSKVLA